MRENESSLRRAEQQARAGHWSRDLTSGEITWSNGTWQVYGLKPQSDKLTMAMLANLIHPEDREIVRQAIEEALAGKRPYEQDYWVVGSDGTIRWIHSSAEVDRDANGQPSRIFGVSIDITERKEAEKLLRQVNAELQASLAEVKTLSGLLPICAWCKKIRDDQDYWQEVETYIGQRSDATFTHGMCPDCAQKYFPTVTLSAIDEKTDGGT